MTNPTKRLWLFNHYAQKLSERGGLARHHALSEHLASNGWGVTIIAASTEHPSGRKRFSDFLKPRLENEESCDFFWIPSVEYNGNGWRRMANMALFSVRCLLPGTFRHLQKPDVILGSSPHPIAAAIGALYAKKHRVPFVYEIRDLWPEVLVAMKRLRRDSIVAKLLYRLERSLVENADLVVTLAPNTSAYMERRRLNCRKLIWLSNGVDVDRFDPAPPKKAGTFTLMYFGAHGGANGLDTVVRAMKLLEDDPPVGPSPVRLRLVGDGPNKSKLEALANELGLKNIVFEPSIPKTDIPRLASQADAFVFSLIDAPMFEFGISPNKLFEYMAAARPILLSCRASGDPVTASQSGLVIPPESPTALADAIRTLLALPQEERFAMGQRARAYSSRHFSLKSIASALDRELGTLIARGQQE